MDKKGGNDLLVLDRYTLDEATHGQGGFARVIKGRDTLLERDVAIKWLDPLVTQFSEPERERFKREARILAKLSHPNIPAIYDVVCSEFQFLILFQFIDGITLGKQRDKEGPCELGDVRRWFAQIASALDHANSVGVIHRDIKPDNIIITPNRESAYLVDFGIALSADEIRKLTQSGYAVGTPGYMSPEQNAGEQLDARSDVYSLGVTRYEALAGRSIPVGSYEELSSANEAIPPQIDDLIRDCLLPKNRRLGSAREFSSRLAGALRPLKPLSEVLAHGRLHELAGAIEELTPDEFGRLPLGQRDLVLLKLGDIVGSGEAELQFASGRFLELLVPRAIHLPSDNDRDIIRPAIRWGFKREFGDRIGREGLRRELVNAAFTARADAHTVLREEFGLFLKDEDLAGKDDWWLHAIRQVLQTLLSNPACTAGTENLVERLKEVNRIQRSRREIR